MAFPSLKRKTAAKLELHSEAHSKGLSSPRDGLAIGMLERKAKLVCVGRDVFASPRKCSSFYALPFLCEAAEDRDPS